MTAKALWRVSVTTSPEVEDSVQECLAAILGQPVSTYTDAETRRTTASVFLTRRADMSPSAQAEIRLALRRLRPCGLDPGRIVVRMEKIRRENWAESWKHHFKPIEIGGALLLRPSWSRRRPKSGQAVVTLDPGLSFGTGQHPTTRFCLEQLVVARKGGSAQSFVDIGTGSGILAIAAARLGYSPVVAFDCDPDAVRIAAANARVNSVRTRVQLRRLDLNQFNRRQYRLSDVICANLTFDLLVAERRRILACLALRGRLVLAGILHSQFPKVRRAYAEAGLRMLAHRREGEWESGAFTRPNGG